VANGKRAGGRVFPSEVRSALRISEAWWYHLLKVGAIPRPHRDPGSRRGWYTEQEAARIINNDRATREPAPVQGWALPKEMH